MNELALIADHALVMTKSASPTAMSYFRKALDVKFKSDESPVTQADKAVEAKLRAYLAEHFADHGIFGEEEGLDLKDSPHLWVLDPIDGTRSFLSGNPLFGMLLAHLIDGVPKIGVIGMPALAETLLGVEGQQATMNGEAISVSSQTELDQAVIYVNEGEKIFHSHPDAFARLMRVGQTRRLAYDCYPHALLAMGHVDVVVDFDLQPYDFLALSSVVKAAGGIMTDWDGNALGMYSDGRVVSAASPQLHEQILKELNC